MREIRRPCEEFFQFVETSAAIITVHYTRRVTPIWLMKLYLV
jgi:hypothetical protein